MQYAVAFLEGIITFISPCLLPMLPIYISYFAGGGERSTKKTLLGALGFVSGFTVIFVAMGTLAGTIGSFLREYKGAVNLISGLIVILFGLNFLGIFKMNLFRGGSKTLNSHEMGFFPAMLFGIIFSLGWTPCVGAFLGSALMLASQQGHVIKGMLMLLCYSLGLGIPFLLSAILIDYLKSAFNWIKKHYRIINTVSGCFLILVGILMATGTLGQKLAPNLLATQTPQETKSTEASTPTTQENESEKILAPDFTVYDLDGNEVHLSDFIGKSVVLNFWASWCSPCKMEMPDFNEKYLEIGEEVQFLIINMTDGFRETVETASAFIAEQGYSFPVFYDTDQDAAATYGVYSLPTTYFIDEEGNAIAQATGAIDEEILQQGIDMIISDR
ncbi:cytochrome c biogenesis protein/redoxin [Faecalicatena contorta]|uniref:cytochrome c biogenesis protein/redoxin n=1 Tax=Faecalicatena contorta TaxID=39482 RepID=UPI002F40646F|nr:redoxin domain-containing protein [Faecalicatena contorta]